MATTPTRNGGKKVLGKRMSIDSRRKNLKLLLHQWGGPSSLAKRLGQSGPSYLSQMANGHRPITEKTARKIEAAVDLPTGWLDQEHEGNHVAKPAVIDPNLVTQVITLLGALAEEERLSLGPAKFADAVAIVYEDAVSNGGQVNERLGRRVLKLAQ